MAEQKMCQTGDDMSRERLRVCLIVALLAGCSSDPYNVEILCETTAENESIRLLRYEQDQFSLIPHMGGHIIAGALVYSDLGSSAETWLSSYIDVTYLEYYSKLVCTRSSIHDNSLLVFPLYLPTMLHPDVHRSAQIDVKENAFIVRNGKGSPMLTREVEAGGPPYVLDQGGQLQNLWQWSTVAVTSGAEGLVARQITFLRSSYLRLQEENPDYFRVWRGYASEHPDRKGCSYCDPVMQRILVSKDDGVSWELKRYEVLSDLPKDFVVRGGEYEYDKVLGKYVFGNAQERK